MNLREREIGARLKAFREGINFSQSEFSKHIGISRDQLASVEYGRTPLRYRIAWDIREAFRLSVDWLWGGDGMPDDLSEDQVLPHPDSPKISKDTLLTEVFKQVHNVGSDFFSSKPEKKNRLDKTEIGHRWFMGLSLKLRIDDWLAELPDGYARDFADKIETLAAQYLKAIPKDSSELIDARYDALLWQRMRAEAVKSLSPFHMRAEAKKQYLTYASTPIESESVKGKWLNLKKQIQTATADTGSKSKLAKFLGVDLTQLSKWLTDSDSAREPGAEYTLQMQAWVNDPKRQ